MKKSTTAKFAVFCNRMVGETKSATSLEELIESKMLKRQKEFWSEIKFKDEQNRTIVISREFVEQGMSILEIISDHLEHGDLAEDIICLNPKGAGTITL